MKSTRSRFILGSAIVLLSASFASAADKGPKEQAFVLKLTSPISTATSKPGDTFTATVVSPGDYSGAVVEGHVRKVQPAENMEKPKAHLLFDFDTLTVGDVTYKIQADLKDVTNSKGVAKVDEEGQVISAGNGGKRAAAGLGGAGLGALAGGLLGGGAGALIGGAAGGAAGYLIAVEMTSSSKNIEFYPGTQFTVQMSGKGVDKGVDAGKVHADETAAETAMAKAAASAQPAAATAH